MAKFVGENFCTLKNLFDNDKRLLFIITSDFIILSNQAANSFVFLPGREYADGTLTGIHALHYLQLKMLILVTTEQCDEIISYQVGIQEAYGLSRALML